MKKRIKKRYWKLKNNYGQNLAILMGIAYGLYAIFARPIIKLLLLCIHKPRQHRLVFESKPDYADNGRALSDYLVKHHYTDRYQIIWLVADPSQFQEFKTKNVKFVLSEGRFHHQRTIRAYYYALTAKFVFFTHSFKWMNARTKGQLYINLWHGCGYKASRRVVGQENVFDYCLVPGNIFTKTKADFFGCKEEQLLPIGYPRYNLYQSTNPNVDKYLASLSPQPRKTILWMPTFIQSKDLIYYDNPISALIGLPLFQSIRDIDTLEQYCREANINLIIKQHRIGSKFKCSDYKQAEDEHIFYLDNDQLDEMGFQLYELLSKSDALITDFSSVAIDYMMLNKPIGFTLDTFDDYAKTRGFVFKDPKKYMPGEHLYQLSDLPAFFAHVNEGIDLGKEQRNTIMCEIHNPSDDYCKRVLDYFHIA